MKKIEDNNHGATTKEDIVTIIEGMVDEIRSGEGDEAKKSVKSHMAYLEFAEKFLNAVKHIRLPEIVTEGWELFAEITEKSANLYLQYVEYNEKAKEKNPGYICTIKESFNLLNMKPRMLTVEDYATLHEVNVGTVRQWIRRGKIRKAQKMGKEWRIPEFVEPVSGKYPDGLFYWMEEKLQDLPTEFSCLNDYDELAIRQIDKNTYKVALVSWRSKKGNDKVITISPKERERLELYLISNPFVTCCDGSLDFESIEKKSQKKKGKDEK